MTDGIRQVKLRAKPSAARYHGLIAMGFILLLIGTTLVGFGIARVLGASAVDAHAMREAHLYSWWVHSLFALAPLTRLFHLVSALLNMLLQPVRARGALSTPFDIVSNPEQSVAADPTLRIGPSFINEFSRTSLLSVEACTECARCHDVCPAHATGKPLSPMNIVLQLRDALHVKGEPTALIASDWISTEEIASCMTCNACVEACPVDIDQVGLLVDLRCGQIEQGQLDGGHQNALTRTSEHGNPWGMSAEQREVWLQGQGVDLVRADETYDILYWIGCAASFDPRMREIAKAMFEILRAAGLHFAVLGNRECCTGDFARRAGDEGMFQQLVFRDTLSQLKLTNRLRNNDNYHHRHQPLRCCLPTTFNSRVYRPSGT